MLGIQAHSLVWGALCLLSEATLNLVQGLHHWFSEQGFIQGVGTRDFPQSPVSPKDFEIDKVIISAMKYRYELLWLFMDQASNLVLPWESTFHNGGPGTWQKFYSTS